MTLTAALKSGFKTFVAMKFVDDDDDDLTLCQTLFGMISRQHSTVFLVWRM